MKKPIELALYEKFVKNKSYKKMATVQKGEAYERQVGRYLEKRGYFVEYRGINLGVKDDGIDLIAQKDDEMILVQCKNHAVGIQQKYIRAFIGDFCIFLREHPKYKSEKIFAYFFSSNGYKKSSHHYKKNKDFLVLKTLGDEWENSKEIKQLLLPL